MAPLPSPKNTNEIKPAKRINKIKSETLTDYEDNDFSTQTEQSKQTVHQNDAQDTSSPLCVAITCVHTGILSNEESELILTAIQKQIISEANVPNPVTTGPTFNSEPLFEEGVLKLWCDNNHTLKWLKNTVSDLCIPRRSLVVKSELEIKKRVPCGFKIPDEHRVFKEPEDIGRAVWYQNPWIEVQRWQWIYMQEYDDDDGSWFMCVGVPEDQIPTLMKAGCRLSIGLTSVHIVFEGRNGQLNSKAPLGWDPATETFVWQSKYLWKSVKTPLIFHPFVVLTGEQKDYLHEMKINNVMGN